MPRKNKSDSSEDETPELKYVREVICERLVRFRTFLNGDNQEVFQLEIRLKSVEDDFSEFDRVQTRLEYLNPEEKAHRLETESEFYDVIARAKFLISSYNNSNKTYLENQTTSMKNQMLSLSGAVARLPDLGLPTFYGKFETWYSFRDIFDSLVNNRADLSEIDKFLYLKVCCKDDALKLIDSLDVTADNYSIALELLQKRYENKRAVINYHVNNILFNLPNAVKENPFLLRKLLDSIHQHKTALEKLRLPVEHWDALLIPIILQKIDERTKREWENKQTDQSLPKLSDLLEFLTKKCFTLEAINNDFSKPNLGSKMNAYENIGTRHSNKRVSGNSRCLYVSNEKPQVSNVSKCVVCHGNHFIYQCPKFSKMSLAEKYSEIRKNNLCSNCLRSGHLKYNCMSSGCKKCHLKHNSSLHVDQTQNDKWPTSSNNDSSRNQSVDISEERPQTSRTMMFLTDGNNENSYEQTSSNHNQSILNKCKNENTSTEKSVVASCSTYNTNQVLLSTATILIEDSNGCWHKCNALLDSGSQSNLLSERLRKKLNLKCEKINAPLSGINQIVTNIKYRTLTKIKSRFNSYETALSFLVLPNITEKLPLFGFNKTLIDCPKHINLADEHFNTPKEIDLLLGAGIFYDLLESRKIKLGDKMPVLQETRLGWILTGTLEFESIYGSRKTVCNMTRLTNKELHDSLSKFWQIEELGTENYLSKDEQYCENFFKDTTRRNDDGRFIVSYPFQENSKNELGDSKMMALKRFENLEKRLENNKGLKEQYLEFMNEYESLGHMTFKCNLNSDNSVKNESFFMPHTAVIRDSITTKCRVVFDASAKSDSNVSFNDVIKAGPTIQSDLFCILLRLRLRKYVLNADIKMMYRCILIEPKERCFQQILWRRNHDEPIKVFELNTVTYGTSSAPFQATRCLKELAIINKDQYPLACKIIDNSFYMDDLLVSVNSKTEAIEIYHELTQILLQAKFELRKWSSNEKSILDHILQTSDSEDDKLVLFHDKKELKTLGIIWDANEDVLRYSVNITVSRNKITKRTILSAVSQIFDPLGLVGPVIVTAKLLIQSLWQSRLDWDQEVTSDLKERWLEFASKLHYLNEIKIDRFVVVTVSVAIELYGFSDSSERAYGACVFVGSVDSHGQKAVRLLTAKSKVAPLKTQTLPRLELLAACLLTELVHKVKNTLDVDVSRIVYFTDSTIVLSWIKVEPCKLKTFVANRVAKIQELSDIESWRHVKSNDNPADIISRGLDPKELVENRMWFNGPTFLNNKLQKFVDIDLLDLEELPEVRATTVTLKVIDECSENRNFDLFKKFSSLQKLRRVTAYILRFKNRTLKRFHVKSNTLTTDELQESLFTLIRLAQNETFKQEISDLTKSNSVSNNSRILSLHPFIDSRNILRVGGRLSNADLSFDQQHPIILPYRHKLTELIILEQHLKYLHAGVQNLLSVIRLKFWPVNGKNAVKRVIKSCVRCYRANPKPAEFLMGSLPRSRVTPSRPFTNCGIDYAGPISVKEGTLRRSKFIKTYICIFVCFATRAVHIEIATDLTTNSFLNALKRFCSRRGKPSNIYSDNGLNFVGANNYFKELYSLINDKNHNDSVFSFLADDQIKWNFIPARSAHVGGLWEAAVKSTKFHLKRVLGNASLNFDEMHTLLAQIESCLNSRPLTEISNDVNDYLPLTPAHFLIGDSLASAPEENVREIPVSHLSRYQRLQQLYQQFWNRWSRDYLASLQKRSKWRKDINSTIKIGSLVVLVEDNLPPLRWPLARVADLHRGADNVIRVVTVRLPSGTLVKRTLAKVCILPVEDKDI